MSQNKDRRKALLEEFKNRKVTGGIYRIVNTQSNKYYLSWTENMESASSFFERNKEKDNCTLPPLRRDWDELGGSVFSFEIVDTIEKKNEQTMEAFIGEVKALFKMWKEHDFDGETY